MFQSISLVSDIIDDEMEIEWLKYNLIFNGIVADVAMSDIDVVIHVVAHILQLDNTTHYKNSQNFWRIDSPNKGKGSITGVKQINVTKSLNLER